jgi:FAD/FMN-containing dehydrogenase
MVPTVGGGMATEHVKRALGADANITSVGERMPAELWGGVAPTPADPARQRLWRGIQQAFDPGRVLNPGILGSVV